MNMDEFMVEDDKLTGVFIVFGTDSEQVHGQCHIDKQGRRLLVAGSGCAILLTGAGFDE